MMKFTKIVTTIGPACDSEEMIAKLIRAGVDIFRFNFKHNAIEWHDERIKRVQLTARKIGVFVGTLIDLQGPEIRINMPYDQLSVISNQLLMFGEEVFKNNQEGFSISHPQIIEYLHEGQKIIADDGAFTFFLERINGQTFLRSHTDGFLKNRRSLNIPGSDFPFPVLIDRDFDGLKLAERNEIDFVALSFVRTAEDIKVLRKEMEKYKLPAKIIAKIETRKSLEHIEEIMNTSDGIMVARGDMGVELPVEEVPYYQKTIIKEAIKKGLPVITATQMLASMTDYPYPTRAEVSDIANAVYDLTDAVMLSGETALGKFPIETVDVMRKTVAFNESKNKVDSRLRFRFDLADQESILCDTAYGLYMTKKNLNETIAGFVVFTETGRTVRLLSRYRPFSPIFAFVHDRAVVDSLTIHFGVTPVFHPVKKNKKITSIDIRYAINELLKKKLVQKGQELIVLQGDHWGKKEGTSTISLIIA